MNEKKLARTLQKLDQLDQLLAELRIMKTCRKSKQLNKIESELNTTKDWVLAMLGQVATLYDIKQVSGRDVLTKRQGT